MSRSQCSSPGATGISGLHSRRTRGDRHSSHISCPGQWLRLVCTVPFSLVAMVLWHQSTCRLHLTTTNDLCLQSLDSLISLSTILLLVLSSAVNCGPLFSYEDFLKAGTTSILPILNGELCVLRKVIISRASTLTFKHLCSDYLFLLETVLVVYVLWGICLIL